MIKNIKNIYLPGNFSKKRTLVIRMIKSQKSNKYFFEEKIVIVDNINNYFKK